MIFFVKPILIGLMWYLMTKLCCKIMKYPVNRATDRLNYYVSGNFFDQDGIAQGSGFRRYNMRANADVKASNWLKVGTTSTVSYEEIEQAQTGEYTSVTPISASHFMMPYWNPYNEDGSVSFN